ncbi:hypothetical protein GGR57DRAFT_500552 [Xylariaceae sp. FL1272]|nr:hypothetical protein GGR57DRAFT_500552 [Xylariaceae sp. FL1272]
MSLKKLAARVLGAKKSSQRPKKRDSDEDVSRHQHSLQIAYVHLDIHSDGIQTTCSDDDARAKPRFTTMVGRGSSIFDSIRPCPPDEDCKSADRRPFFLHESPAEEFAAREKALRLWKYALIRGAEQDCRQKHPDLTGDIIIEILHQHIVWKPLSSSWGVHTNDVTLMHLVLGFKFNLIHHLVVEYSTKPRRPELPKQVPTSKVFSES